MDEGLNWDNQLSKVKGKMSGGLRSLRKLKYLIDPPERQTCTLPFYLQKEV